MQEEEGGGVWAAVSEGGVPDSSVEGSGGRECERGNKLILFAIFDLLAILAVWEGSPLFHVA